MKTFLRMVLIFGFMFFATSVWTAEADSIVFDNTDDEIDYAAACVQPPSGMVSWWPGDNSANDLIGTNNGTMMNGATYAPGVVGQAFSFDGVDDYVVVPDSASLDVTTQFTLDAWVYSRGDAGGWPDKAIISKIGGGGGNNGYQMVLSPLGGGNWRVFCGFNANGEAWPTNVVVGGNVTENAWHHIACTYDNNDLKIYVNGTIVGTTNVGSKSVVNSSSTLRISGDDNTHAYFYGYIDEAGVFNRALTAAEVAAIYNAGSAGICRPPAAPSNPSNLTATAASSTQIDLGWKDNSLNETGFKLERKAGICASTNAWSQITKPAANVIAYHNTGLTENTKYSYRIRAYNTSGNSGYSNCATTTTPAALPGVPTSLTAAVVSAGRIDLGWKDNATNETGFKLERKAGICTSTNAWSQIAKPAANVIAYQNTGLTANTKYSYRLRAYNATGNSAYSNCATATTAASKPGAPTTLTAAAVSAGRIDLAWKDNSTNETGFKLERKAGICTSTNTWAQIAMPAANVISYQNTGLTANKKYSYRLRAYNATGNSAYSNCATATTAATEPPKITSITPNSAKVGDTVTISGTGFGPTQGISTVTFNGTVATASSWSDTTIIAVVPEGAATGNVVATVNGTQSNGILFTVEETFTTTVNPSSSPQTVSYKNVSITIPGGLLTQAETLKITTKAAPTLTDGTLAGLDSYDITLGQSGKFAQALTLKFTYDKTKLDPGLPEGKGLFVGYWDTGLNQWVTVKFTVNTVTKQVIVNTDHLSTWVYWTLHGFKYVPSSNKHFNVYYDPTETVPLIHPPLGYTMKNFAADTAGYLEHAYTKYQAAGFEVPDFVNAIISSTHDDSEMNPFSGNIFLKTTALNTYTKMKNDSAHELFHVVQNNYLTVYGMGYGRMWFTEGTPDYAASRIAWDSTIPLDAKLNSDYFNTSITSPDKAHAYQLDQFIEYLVTTVNGVSFKGLWDFVSGVSAPTTLSTLNAFKEYITGLAAGDSFNYIWDKYVAFSFLDIESTMPSKISDKGDVRITDTRLTGTKNISLPATYTATALELTTVAPVAGGNRQLIIESLTNLPVGVSAEIYMVPDKTSVGKYTFLKSLYLTKIKSDAIELKDTDCLFVIVANTSNSDQTVSIKVSSGPVITSLNPTTGKEGDTVTISGTGFGASQLTSKVTFKGTVAAVTSWSGTSIVAKVPTGATTGNVVVTVGGAASNGMAFTVSAAPVITSLTPTSGKVGDTVTISGTGFGALPRTSKVTFKGTVASITSWSGTSIVAKVPTGATTGNVVVTVNGVASNGVKFSLGPVITLLTPSSGKVGDTVTITGTGFGATQLTSTITFNGKVASASSWSGTSIVAKVPTGATTGNIVVTVIGVASNGVKFTVSAAPVITSLTPTSGKVGDTVTISGTRFGASQLTSKVTFKGTVASITSWSGTSIVAKVPTGATTGNVVVTVNGVASNGVTFTLVSLGPVITSLNPSSGKEGDSVTISGTGFGTLQLTSTVTFNGTGAPMIAGSWSDTSGVARVPAGATTGNVVVTVNGVASNGMTFTVEDCINDPSTGLCWDIKDSGSLPDLVAAGTYCSGKGTRLPTIEELVLFATEGEVQFSGTRGYLYGSSATDLRPRLEVRGYKFTAYTEHAYWSSTTDAVYPGNAWYVSFDVGVVGSIYKDYEMFVRCVR